MSFPSCFEPPFRQAAGSQQQTRDAHPLFRNQEVLSRKAVNEREKSWLDTEPQ
jgi:hypothetical protein